MYDKESPKTNPSGSGSSHKNRPARPGTQDFSDPRNDPNDPVKLNREPDFLSDPEKRRAEPDPEDQCWDVFLADEEVIADDDLLSDGNWDWDERDRDLDAESAPWSW